MQTKVMIVDGLSDDGPWIDVPGRIVYAEPIEGYADRWYLLVQEEA